MKRRIMKKRNKLLEANRGFLLSIFLITSLFFLLLEIQNFLGWSRIGISTLHSFAKVWETGGPPILVGLSETHVRTEEELAEDVEKKLPNLPVAFIQEYKKLVKAEQEKRKAEEEKAKAANITIPPKKVTMVNGTYFAYSAFLDSRKACILCPVTKSVLSTLVFWKYRACCC